MLKQNKKSVKNIVMMMVLALLVAFAVVMLVGGIANSIDENIGCEYSLASSNLNPPNNNVDPDESYNKLRTNFYNILNQYVVPTTVALGIAILTISLVTLGIQRAKEEEEAKIKVLNKRMIWWTVGAAMVFLAPVIVMGIAELAIGIMTNWGNI